MVVLLGTQFSVIEIIANTVIDKHVMDNIENCNNFKDFYVLNSVRENSLLDP